MKLYNSLTRKKEKFVPINSKSVGFYACGPTVYGFVTIGNWRTYILGDILLRWLKYLGYGVNYIMNITDVGHLVSDADEGEDKLEKGAKALGKTVWEVAEYYTQDFFKNFKKLNLVAPKKFTKATDHIKEQIEMVEDLITKGFAYDTPEAVYYDVSKFGDYGKLSGQNLDDKKVAVRREIQTGKHKRNSADFALWFKTVGRFKDHVMHWSSPWGDGFPGWHIECSAMSVKYLGQQFDIHVGGEDLLPVHHTNEIAQSEAATGKSPFVKYWLHGAHLQIDGGRMGKSLGNAYTLEDIEKRGFDAMDLRYFYLLGHYRKKLNFTWEALEAAKTGLKNLRSLISAVKRQTSRTVLSEEKQKKTQVFREKFKDAISDDINVPKALAVLWEAMKSNIPSGDKYDLAMNFDEVLGLDLGKTPKRQITKVPNEVQKLVEKREKFRKERKFEEADKVRKKIEDLGYTVKDSEKGSLAQKN